MSDQTDSPMSDSPRQPYDYHAGFYRDIRPEDLSRPWRASPVPRDAPQLSPLRPAFELPTSVPLNYGPNHGWSPTSPASPSSTITINVPKFPNRKLGLYARIMRFVKTGDFSLVETVKVDIPVYSPSFDPAEDQSKVKLHEWKAYGYYARPIINRVECPNSPATSENSITTEALYEIATSLRSPNGEKHPERWIPGVKHRSLPARPSRWSIPEPGKPLPFPWEVQVNPLLQHPLWGPAPISWCLWNNPIGCNVWHGRVSANVPVNNADFAQPATWPFLTHMHFNAVAGDSAPTFPWPFTVANPRGVKVGDVLSEIYRMFQFPVMEEEKSSWEPVRQSAAKDAWVKRCEIMSDQGQPPYEDMMRRCDSFGGVMFFRGIEPTIDGGGWMITFGNH